MGLRGMDEERMTEIYGPRRSGRGRLGHPGGGLGSRQAYLNHRHALFARAGQQPGNLQMRSQSNPCRRVVLAYIGE